jgi:DNA ligase (NAD+)
MIEDRKVCMIEQIVKASEDYYLGQQTLTDQEFDILLNEFKEIFPDDPIIKTVGYGARARYGDVVSIPDGIQKSLNKIYSLEEAKKTLTCKTENFAVEPKVDGMSGFIWLKGGEIIKACSREGVSYTPKMKYLSNFKFFSQVPDGVYRGEFFISVKVFEEFKEELGFANPRNGVAGILNRKSFEGLEYVRFEIHEKIDDINGTFDFYYELPAQTYVFPYYLSNSKPYVELSDQLILEIKDQIIKDKVYPIDGIVISGAKNGQPDCISKVAYKFPTEEKEVKIKKIEWNRSKTGQLVPVAVFDPVELYGTKVTRCTLLHAKYVQENNIGLGSVIAITKNNEIVPGITRVIKSTEAELPSGEWDGVGLYNYSFLNYDRLINFLSTYFVEKGLVGLDGICEILQVKTIPEFLDMIETTSSVDIFEKLWNSKGFTKKKAEIFSNKIKEFFEKGLNASLFMQSLCIKNVGVEFSKVASDKLDLLKDVDLFCKETEADIAQEKEIKSNHEYILETYNRVSKYLKVMDIKLKTTVIITGTLSVPRDAFVAELGRAGVGQSTIARCDYLIQSDPSSTSNKTKTAKKRGIPILSEREARKLFGLM